MARIDFNTLILREKLRIGAILESPLAAGREGLAMELALRTSMDAEGALAMLEKAPKASTSAAGSFLNALRGEALDLHATGAADALDDPKAKRLAEIKANTRRVAKAPKGA